MSTTPTAPSTLSSSRTAASSSSRKRNQRLQKIPSWKHAEDSLDLAPDHEIERRMTMAATDTVGSTPRAAARAMARAGTRNRKTPRTTRTTPKKTSPRTQPLKAVEAGPWEAGALAPWIPLSRKSPKTPSFLCRRNVQRRDPAQDIATAVDSITQARSHQSGSATGEGKVGQEAGEGTGRGRMTTQGMKRRRRGSRKRRTRERWGGFRGWKQKRERAEMARRVRSRR